MERADVAGRLGRLRPRLAEAGCDALLVTHLVNVRYLTGFTGSAGLLLVLPDDIVLSTDGRYRDQAAEQQLRARLDRTVRADKRLLDAYQAGAITLAELSERRQVLASERQALERQQEAAEERRERSRELRDHGPGARARHQPHRHGQRLR